MMSLSSSRSQGPVFGPQSQMIYESGQTILFFCLDLGARAENTRVLLAAPLFFCDCRERGQGRPNWPRCSTGKRGQDFVVCQVADQNPVCRGQFA